VNPYPALTCTQDLAVIQYESSDRVVRLAGGTLPAPRHADVAGEARGTEVETAWLLVMKLISQREFGNGAR